MQQNGLTVLEDGQATHTGADQHTHTGGVQLGITLGVALLLQAGLDQGLLAGDHGVLQAVIVAASVLLVNQAAGHGEPRRFEP